MESWQNYGIIIGSKDYSKVKFMTYIDSANYLPQRLYELALINDVEEPSLNVVLDAEELENSGVITFTVLCGNNIQGGFEYYERQYQSTLDNLANDMIGAISKLAVYDVLASPSQSDVNTEIQKIITAFILYCDLERFI